MNQKVVDGKLKEKVYKKIPENLEETLNNVFIKAFEITFNNGTSIIEKSFDKEKINLEYEVNKFVLDYKENSKNIKNLDNQPKKSNLLNNVFTTSVGTGMGILGLGIPDIPLFVATILRGIYQVALSYGFDYKTKKEKIYILRLIRTALAKTPGEKYKHNEVLENGKYYNIILEDEIKYTAQVMANALLLEKFIQGIPVVGAVDGVVNNSIYRKISNFSMIKYKKRYIKVKLNDN